MEATFGNNAPSRFSIRTSDRRTFRRCLRKWDFQSSLRQNLTRSGAEQNINFWFGSAIHFCMEDYYGYNRFKDPRRALYAYYHAFKEDELPLGAEMHYSLGISMLTYFLQWMEKHNQQTGFETMWLNPETYVPMEPGDEGAVPAVEISFYLPLQVYAIMDVEQDEIVDSFFYDGGCDDDLKSFLECHPEIPKAWNPGNDPETTYTCNEKMYRVIGIYYHGTIDRIVKDRYGRYWLWDWKTAKSADTAKLATDDQVSAYLWAASKLFPFPVYGFVYLQMTKERVQEPKRLKNGTLSTDKRQRTTYALLRKAIIDDYGEVNSAPSSLIQFLNHLASLEEPEGDRFIRWDFVKRTPAQLQATERAIYGELDVMLNPNLYCYPSPTRDCSWDCPMRDACIFMDQGDYDAYHEFISGFEKRPHSEDGNQDAWRDAIAWPRIGSDGNPELIPLEDIMEYDSALEIRMVEDPDDGIKFYYEEDS